MCDKNKIGQNEFSFFNTDLCEFNESVYIITHCKELKEACIESLYGIIKEENSDFRLYMGGGFRLEAGEKTHDLDLYGYLAKEIIDHYISISNNCFILHNPESGEPSIILYAGDFIPEEMRLQYQYKETNDSGGIGTFVLNNVTKELEIYALQKTGEMLSRRAQTLSNRAGYMSSRAGRRSATRSLSSLSDKNRALQQLAKNYNKTLKSSAFYKSSGSVLSGLAKIFKAKSFNVFTMWLTATPVGDSSIRGPQKQEVERFVKKSLSAICIKYNNFHYIMNQSYISPAQ